MGRSPHAEAFQKPEPSLPASHAGRPALWPGAASPAPEESGHQELMRSYLNKASLRRNTVRWVLRGQPLALLTRACLQIKLPTQA